MCRTIPNILNYSELLCSDFRAPNSAHTGRIHKTTGTKVHVTREMLKGRRRQKALHRFNVMASKLGTLLQEQGL